MQVNGIISQMIVVGSEYGLRGQLVCLLHLISELLALHKSIFEQLEAHNSILPIKLICTSILLSLAKAPSPPRQACTQVHNSDICS